jgi:hypothetical protein
MFCVWVLQDIAGSLYSNTAGTKPSYTGYIHVSDEQQLAAMAGRLIAHVLTTEAAMLTVLRTQQQPQQLFVQKLLQQHQSAAEALHSSVQQQSAMTQRQGHQYWQQWQQQQQQQPGSVWAPSNSGLPEARYHALLEQVAMVAEVGAAVILLLC